MTARSASCGAPRDCGQRTSNTETVFWVPPTPSDLTLTPLPSHGEGLSSPDWSPGAAEGFTRIPYDTVIATLYSWSPRRSRSRSRSRLFPRSRSSSGVSSTSGAGVGIRSVPQRGLGRLFCRRRPRLAAALPPQPGQVGAGAGSPAGGAVGSPVGGGVSSAGGGVPSSTSEAASPRRPGAACPRPRVGRSVLRQEAGSVLRSVWVSVPRLGPALAPRPGPAAALAPGGASDSCWRSRGGRAAAARPAPARAARRGSGIVNATDEAAGQRGETWTAVRLDVFDLQLHESVGARS